jgi:Kdo2-lipid IVA lauroyltransferase/acyltransferase
VKPNLARIETEKENGATTSAPGESTADADDAAYANTKATGAARSAQADGDAGKPSTLARLKLSRKDWWLFQSMRAVVMAFSLLPDFILYRLGVLGGYIGFLLDRRHVAIAMVNLAIAFPERSEPERRRILRDSYLNLGRSGAEYVRLAGFFYRRLVSRVTYERFHYWDEIKRRYPGRGIVVLTAHFGNFELLAAAHALHGHQITLVHHTQRFVAGDAFITWVRERAGVDLARKRSAARAVLKALGDGELVGIPFDQNAKRGEAIFVPFFGEPAATSRTLARLVQKSQAIVVPVFIVREPDNRSHRIVIQDLIPLQDSGDADADVAENTARFLRPIEDIVRRYPEQFLWQHRRYRTRPRGMAPLYEETRRHRDSRPKTPR